MNDDIKMWLQVIGFVTLMLVIIIAPMIICSAIYEVGYCTQMAQAHESSWEFQWFFWGGCMVKTPEGRWVDANYYYPLEQIETKE